MLYKKNINTEFQSVIEITKDITECVEQSGVKSGVCVVSVPHTTAGLFITSFWDPNGHIDIQDDLDRIIPTRINFKHQFDTPSDASGHIKSAIVGSSLAIIVDDGKPLLGSSQGVFFAEFDGPRPREYFIKVVKEG